MLTVSRTCALIFFALTLNRTAEAQVPSARAHRTSASISIDGLLAEADWNTATVAGSFTQSFPNPGKRALNATEIRVLYDDHALYVGVRMLDPHPDSIRGQLARRDAAGLQSDNIEIMIDSYHDQRTAFRFSVNPVGVKRDVLSYNDVFQDENWDAVWEVATRVDSAGWTAEFRIPFSQLRFGSVPDGGERRWGFQVMRDVARTQGRDSWAPWQPQDAQFVSRFGELTGLVNIPDPRRLEIAPYVRSRYREEDDVRFKAGLDAKYGLPAGLTLTATINPDFGQAEVDPAVVNLTAFETFFPEKRPFFLEGADVFRFGQLQTNNSYGFQQYFYSRRVGRDETNILGAAKITGQAGPWTIGVLNALTQASEDYTVATLRRGFRNNRTLVGAMLTSTLRLDEAGNDAGALRNRAFVSGVDFVHGWANQSWILSGSIAASNVRGSRVAVLATQRSSAHYFQRPDADYLAIDSTRTGLNGSLVGVALRHQGSIWGSVEVKQSSPGLELNDAGFQNRTDYRSVATAIGKQEFQVGKRFRNYTISGGSTQSWNYGGQPLTQIVYGGANAMLLNFWSGGFSLQASPEAYSDRITRGGPLIRTAGWVYGRVFFASDTRRAVWFSAGSSLERDRDDSYFVSHSAGIHINPSAAVQISLQPSFDISHNVHQYVTTQVDGFAPTFGSRYVFARLHQRTTSLDTRLSWTLRPTLSIELFAQPFVSAGRYDEFKQLARPGTREFSEYAPSSGFALPTPDFDVHSLRGNAVFRWEYRPGSTFFAVWQHNRSGGLEFGPGSNVFLVKASYWVGR